MPQDRPRIALQQAAHLPDPTSLPRLASLYVREYADKIEAAIEALDDDQLWWRPSPNSNSIANLLLHLRGNLSLWVLASLGGLAFHRHRAAEFREREEAGEEGETSGAKLWADFEATIAAVTNLLDEIDPNTLGEAVDVQGYESNRLGVIFHAVEHLSYHTGQIVFAAKALRGTDRLFEFYPHHTGE